jgi:hypothetical protein
MKFRVNMQLSKQEMYIKFSIIWNITTCSPLKVKRHFEGTHGPHLQSWRFSACFLFSLPFNPEDRGVTTIWSSKMLHHVAGGHFEQILGHNSLRILLLGMPLSCFQTVMTPYTFQFRPISTKRSIPERHMKTVSFTIEKFSSQECPSQYYWTW